MSKIKDLYAEVEDIDDLKPVRTRKDIIREELLARGARFIGLEDWIYARAEWGVELDEEGHWVYEIKNFDHIADTAATDLVDGYIEDQHYDMSDEMYSELIDEVGDELSRRWQKIVPSLMNRRVEDEKEEWAQYKTYMNETLPKE